MIDGVRLQGFKGHRDLVDVDLAPLTLLAGANSSGKSSVMQALLLLKQTSDSAAESGPLRLTGPHVFFESHDDFVHHGKVAGSRAKRLRMGLRVDGRWATSTFSRVPIHGRGGARAGLVLTETGYGDVRMHDGVQVADILSDDDLAMYIRVAPIVGDTAPGADAPVRLRFDRGFVTVDLHSRPALAHVGFEVADAQPFRDDLARVIHLPGHRGNPQRRYAYATVSGEAVPVPFPDVYAGVLADWSDTDEGAERLRRVGEVLAAMGLGWKVQSRRPTHAHVEVRLSRTARPQVGGAEDLVALADVGFGVSQVLPVVVALVYARPGQLVYVEQPEMHLHPAAQAALADACVAAAARGVRVVLETHAEAILLSVQLAVAEDRIASGDVRLHWFQRDDDGVSTIVSETPRADGSFGHWPVDFGERALDLQGRYLDAAARKPAP